MHYPRYSEQRLRTALQDTPVVLIHGSRQCGKTTLTQAAGGELGYHYSSLDDNNQLAAAQTDPVGFVAALPAARKHAEPAGIATSSRRR